MSDTNTYNAAAEINQRTHNEIASALGNAIIGQINANVRAEVANRDLQQLQARYGKLHAEVQALDAQITELRAAREAEQGAVVRADPDALDR